jgi:glyoxylase-like metal-dependent hydrolase (beta-lactamase superfamily II)
VLVVDATYLPSRARADIALIRTVTNLPVRYLVYTHWHFDHNNGGIAYREAFPNVTIVSERETGRFIDLNATWWAKMNTREGSPKRKALAELERRLQQGRDSTGQSLSAQAREDLALNVRQRRGELEELGSLAVVKPDLVFDRELTLTLGHRRIQIHDWGKANSPHDVTVYLPDERILFTGDILVHDPFPYLGASWPVPWAEVLRQVEQLPAGVIVPGHGGVMHDHAYVTLVRELLEAVTTRVEALAREGHSLEEIQNSATFDEFRPRFDPSTAPDTLEGWKISIRILVERVWRGVRGQG